MRALLRAVRYSAVGGFFAGIATVLAGCSAREGALLAALLLGLQLCSAQAPNTLYWIQLDADETSVFKCDLDGPLPCTPELVIDDTLTGNDLSAVEVGPHGVHLYWAIEGFFGGLDGFIRRCRLGGSACTPETVANVGDDTPDQLHIDVARNRVYWSSGEGFIRGCSLDALPCVPFNVSNPGPPGFWFGVEQFGDVLFASGPLNFIHRCPLNSAGTCTLEVLTQASNPRALKVDPKRGYLYVARTNSQGVFRCSLETGGCKQEHVAATAAGFPSALGVDLVRNHLYWRAQETTLDRCALDGALPCAPADVVLQGIRVRQVDLGP